MRRATSVDIALVSCGDMTPRSLLVQTPTVSENITSLLDAGAIGDLLGVFLDEDGNPIDHPLAERVLSLSLKDLKAVRHSILASGGLYKFKIIRAILRAGYVKTGDRSGIRGGASAGCTAGPQQTSIVKRASHRLRGNRSQIGSNEE